MKRKTNTVLAALLAGVLLMGCEESTKERPDERAVNTLTYTRAEIERVARVAFEPGELRGTAIGRVYVIGRGLLVR